MAYDVAGVRGRYVSLGDGWTYLNAHEHAQIPARVASGVSRAFRTSMSPTPGGGFEGDQHVLAAREAVAELVGSEADLVVLGSSLESLYRDLIRAMRPMLKFNSSIVTSSVDRPELTAALEDGHAQVRKAHPDLSTGELPAFQYDTVVDRTTRLVSLPAAHHLLGTVAPVRSIVDRSHAHARLWVLVDVSAYAAYRPVSFDEWDADILALDLAALGGPQLSALIFRGERMFRRLDPLNPLAEPGTREAISSPVSPGLAGGVRPLVDHYAELDPTPANSWAGSASLRDSMLSLSHHMSELSRDLITFVGSLPAVHIFGVSGEAAAGVRVERIPRITFAVKGVPAATVHRRLLDNGLFTTLTPETELMSAMGVDEVGGAVTVSLAPFNRHHDIEQLTRVIASLA